MKNDFIKALMTVTEKHIPFAVVTVVTARGSAPREIGAKMIVDKDENILWGTIGGGSVEKLVLEETVISINTLQPKLIQYTLGAGKGEETEMICGGNMTFFIEPYSTEHPHVVIVGAGHIATTLAPLCKQCGFLVTVVDDRKKFATKDRFPDVDNIVYATILEKALEQINFTSKTYVVIISYCHKVDERALRYCINKPWKYIGMIASLKKSHEIKKRLLADKITTEEKVNMIHSPIGIPIGGKRPIEIAVSIIAELIKVKIEGEK